MADGIDVTPKKDGGILKKITREGTGDDGPQTGDSVSVHYVGTLTDGSQFDSSRDRNDKFQFLLGKGQVIKAWDIGVATMKRGERCTLTCQADYAYGVNGSPPKIPPNATLVFDVELFDWKGEDLSPDNDGTITRTVIDAGTGFATPNDGATVEVHLVGKHNNKVFEELDVTFALGDGCDNGVVAGVEHVLKSFKMGEKSVLHMDAKHAFGKEGDAAKGIPPNANVNYEVTLKTFEKAKEPWEMDPAERVEQSELAKAKGTKFFMIQNIPSALRNYEKVVSILESEKDTEDETKGKRRELLLAAYLNLAMCHLKTKEPSEVLRFCEKALEMEPQNVKGIFRQGMARMMVQDYQEAIDGFEQVVQLDPSNKAAANQIVIAKRHIQAQLAKDKRLYAGMFEKLAELDAQDEKAVKKEDIINGDGDQPMDEQKAAAEKEPAAAEPVAT